MHMLQIKRLDQGTALQLVKASKALSWSSLYPILNAMAMVTLYATRDDHELTVLHVLNALEALHLLLGEALLLCCRVVSKCLGWVHAQIPPFAWPSCSSGKCASHFMAAGLQACLCVTSQHLPAVYPTAYAAQTCCIQAAIGTLP